MINQAFCNSFSSFFGRNQGSKIIGKNNLSLTHSLPKIFYSIQYSILWVWHQRIINRSLIHHSKKNHLIFHLEAISLIIGNNRKKSLGSLRVEGSFFWGGVNSSPSFNSSNKESIELYISS